MQAKQIRRGILCGAVLGCGLLASSADAALLYQWNMDSNSGTGTLINPATTPNNVSADGGVLTMGQYGGTTTITPKNLYSPAGGGSTGGATDYSFDNSASVSNNTNPGGIAYSTGVAAAGSPNTLNALPNIGVGQAVTAYTLTMWVKPTAAELSVQSRLFQISTNAATSFDESTNGLWVGLNAGKIQTGGSSANNNFVLGNTLVANAWNFVAVEVDLAASNVFFDGNMQAANGQNDSIVLYQGDSTSNVYGVTGQNGALNGSVSFASQGDYAQLLNGAGKAGNRAFQGQGDDFRIYSGLLTTAQLQSVVVAGSPVPEPTSFAVIVCATGMLVSRRRR